MLEINIGIICACIVLMRPLFHDCKAYFEKSFGREKPTSIPVDTPEIGFGFRASESSRGTSEQPLNPAIE